MSLIFQLSFILFSLEIIYGKQTRNSKRMLLPDPDLRLSQVEQILQETLRHISDLQAELTKEKARTSMLEQTIHNFQSHGSTYVRWGRSDCSAPNTELVYKGYAAGEKYLHVSNQYGGAANTLCLPDDPELSNRTITAYSHIYGSEYNDGNFAPDALDEDVPCAVCRSRNTSSSLMIPGRKSCYNGWKKEYEGFLASGSYTHAASSYICIDAHPSYIIGGKRSNDEHLLYVTSMKCGSLPCPPYSDGLEVYCVVCSQ